MLFNFATFLCHFDSYFLSHSGNLPQRRGVGSQVQGSFQKPRLYIIESGSVMVKCGKDEKAGARWNKVDAVRTRQHSDMDSDQGTKDCFTMFYLYSCLEVVFDCS